MPRTTQSVVLEQESSGESILSPGMGREVHRRPPSVVVNSDGGCRVFGTSPATMHVIDVGHVIPKK
jgi:hypothetical protein